MADRGHLFVIDGDLTKVACDAWLLPTDPGFDITKAWQSVFPREEITQHGPEGDEWWTLDSRRWNRNELGEVIRYGDVDGSTVYLANIGHDQADTAVYTGAALDFIHQATAEHEQKAGALGRRVRVAINQIGSGHGGGKQVRGGILENLIKSVEAGLNSGAITADVVLVCWGEKAEAAAQYLRLDGRQEYYPTSEQWSFVNNNLDLHNRALELALHFKARNACIFMGAGVSGGSGLPMWSELLDELASDLPQALPVEYSDADNLRKASLLKSSMGADDFAARISSALNAPKYSLVHGLLSSLPCDEFITTNVERLFERAASSKERGITILPSLKNHHLIDRWLLKIHGCVSDPGTLVFTDEDYARSVSSRRALFGVLQAMLLTRHIVFVGYSLTDPDFREIVEEVRAALPATDGTGNPHRRKLGTVLTLFTDNSNVKEYEDLFEIVAISSVLEQDRNAAAFDSAVRDLERFLDLVGMLSSDRAAFLLDGRYSALLSDEEQELSRLLNKVVSQRSRLRTASGWDQVWDVLHSLGAHPRKIGKDRPSVLSDVPYRSNQ